MIKTHIRSSSSARKHAAKDAGESRSGPYNASWRRLRLKVLSRNPLCVECEKAGRVQSAEEVDHITPHRGDMGLFYDIDNLQGLCKRHHSMKTAQEVGRSEGGATMTPAWLPKSQKPIVLVCGAPASGKSTYVSDNAKENDLVVDLGLMAEAEGKKIHLLDTKQMNALIRKRNEILGKFMRGQTRHDKAWVIATAGNSKHRQFWFDRGAEIVIMDTPKDVCQRRIHVRDIPTPLKIKQIQVVEDWE